MIENNKFLQNSATRYSFIIIVSGVTLITGFATYKYAQINAEAVFNSLIEIFKYIVIGLTTYFTLKSQSDSQRPTTQNNNVDTVKVEKANVDLSNTDTSDLETIANTPKKIKKRK